MKKLLSILGAVGLTATGASVAVSCSGHKETTAKDLTKLVEVKEVTVVKGSNEDAILDAVIEANKAAKLVKTDLVVVKITDEYKDVYTLKSAEGKTTYTGEVVLSVIFEDEQPTAKDLTKLVEVKEVTVVDGSNEDAILDAVIEANSAAELVKSDLVVVKTTAEDKDVYTLKSAEGKTTYTGEVVLTVNFNQAF